MTIDPVLAGQIRHVLSFAGGAGVAGGVAADTLEAAIGGLVLALLGHALSWLAKRRAAAG